ncbi:MAG: CBS domain-containing protein [Caldilineaceae bacterium]|jgi:CBS domain-containing protein
MQISEIMSSPAITVATETRIGEVARLMRENDISGMPVVDERNRLLGVITEHDLIQRHAPVHQPRYITVLSAYIPISPREVREYQEQLRQTLAINASQLMTIDAHTVSPDADVEDALELMLDPEVTLLPVVRGREVIGVVTRTDLVRLIERLESQQEDGASEADEGESA